jgi:glycerophosphoryl diester phosphodiesterase
MRPDHKIGREGAGGKMRLIGHRGARGLFPENTLEGFARTIALGVDGIEIDVAMTADGVAVVTHDAALNPDITRAAGGAWLPTRGRLIRELRLADLSGFDVGRIRPGTDYAALYSDQQAVDGARIPTLADTLALPAHFTVELKTFPKEPAWTAAPAAMAEAVAEIAEAAGAAGRIVVQSFDWRGPRHLRRLRPDLSYAWLTSAETVAAARLWWDGPCPDDFAGSVPRAVAAEGGSIWSPAFADLTADLLAEAQGLGLQVIPWTVNQAADIARLAGWGVDGLITDRPDIARRALGPPQAA